MTKTSDGRCSLFRWERDKQTATQCLAFSAGPLRGQCDMGFAYTTGNCRFCIVDVDDKGGAVLRERGTDGALGAVDIDNAFELRLFGEHFELRWVRTTGSAGRMTICTDVEVSADLNAGDARPDPRLPEVEPIAARWLDHGYLLWGMAPDKSGGDADWTRLTSARIGELWVPPIKGGVRSKARLVLKAREYFTVADAGNVVFAGERLLGFAEAEDTKAKGNGEAHVG